jgi:hypothetical protein
MVAPPEREREPHSVAVWHTQHHHTTPQPAHKQQPHTTSSTQHSQEEPGENKNSKERHYFFVFDV